MSDASPPAANEPALMPPRIASHRTNTVAWRFIIGAVVLGCAALLFFFNPLQHGFYPRCALHSLTGLQCPGCGGLRATHQLLHGNLSEALKLNALVVVGLPFLAWGVWRELAGGGLKLRPRWIVLMGVVLIVFGILRNLPGFGWLSP
jgi:drug/metabolite transporter (DMT)-like permease